MENEVKWCEPWCGHDRDEGERNCTVVHGYEPWCSGPDDTHFCSLECDHAKRPLHPAPPSPVEVASLLTFAEAMALDPSEVEARAFGTAEWRSLVDMTGATLSLLRKHTSFRLKPKPAPALGRCHALVADAAAAYSNQPDSRAFREVVGIAKRSADEALRQVLEQGTSDIIAAVERARAVMLGPGVPPQGADR